MEQVKTCKTCAYRDGVTFNGAKCMLSGFYCTTERQSPSVCGQNFENWVQRPPSIWQKLFFGEKK